MADVVTRAVRSRMMAGIKGKNTRPEILLRKSIHRAGFRFRLHGKDLPGKPDIVLPKWNAVIFVHGCFWHGHTCHLYRLPKTRTGFWRDKIGRNRSVDRRVIKKLRHQKWRVGVVWECAMRGRSRLPAETVVLRCISWLRSKSGLMVIKGAESRRAGIRH